MVYKKSENQVRFMLADTILALCGSTIDYRSEVKVEGLLGVTIDDHEVFLVQINKSMRKGNPGTPKKITSITGRTRRNTPKSITKFPGKKAKEKTDKPEKEDRSEETPEASDKLETRQSKRKRKASWKVNLNLKDDHDYTASSDKGDGKKKKDLVPLDSSDSEEETTDGKSSNVLAEPEVVYIQDEGASTSKAGNADSGESDDEVPTMPDIEPMDHSDDEAPQPENESDEEFGKTQKRKVGRPRKRGKRVRPKKTCEECQKVFHDSSSLRIHMRIHSGEKPFSCPYCQRSFRQRAQMRGHVKSIHTDPKSKQKTFNDVQKCTQCPKMFVNKEKLDLHVRVIHNNERPFECELCDKSFCTKNSLQTHMRKGNHGHFRRQQKCTCPVCFKIFPEAAKLESHIATNHIEIPLVRLVESDGREVLGVNVKSIPGLEKTLKSAEVKQEVMSEAGDAVGSVSEEIVTMETDGLERHIYPETSQDQETLMLHPVQGPADQVSTTTDIVTNIVNAAAMSEGVPHVE